MDRRVSASRARARQVARAAPWLALSLLSAAMSSAFAQSAPSPATAASPASPGEKKAEPADSTQQITISATRRRELIRDVPLAMTAVAAERLQEVGAKSLNDYLATQPGVILQNSGVSDNGGSIVIRGLTAGIDSNSPTTVYLDDTPLAAGTTFDLDLLDLRRFEVLRGPQGTLYGASAMGGVLKYVSNEPDTYNLSGKVGVGLSQTKSGGLNKQARAVVNVPLSQDVAALRVAVVGTHDDGYVDATGPAGKSNVNKKDGSGGRISLLVTPTKQLSLKFVAMTQTLKSEGNDRISYDFASRQPKAGDLVYEGLVFAEPRKGQRQLYAGTVEYDLGWARFSSITSSQRSKDDLVTDFSSFAQAFGFDRGIVVNNISQNRDTQEFRLVSQAGGSFDWLLGAYYNKSDSTSYGLTQGYSGATAVPFQQDTGTSRFKEQALYGNVTWNATPELAITGGLRAASYKKTDTVVQSSAPAKTIQFDESPKTYLLTAKYRLTSQSNLYARVASGYRPGGVNFAAVDATNTPIPGAPASYGTDEAVTYEAGYKASLGAGASLEVTVFNTDWKNLQQVTRSALGGFTSNLGKARIRGLEAAASLQPTPALTLGAALSLLDPKLLTDSPGLGGKDGDRLPSSAKVAAALTGRYAFELAGRGAFAALNASYQGSRYSSFEGSPSAPNFVMPGFLQIDTAAGINLGAFDLGLYVRNLADKRGIIGAATSETLPIGRTYARVITPRTIGITLGASF
jgi:outer membrane receptor protein involved in Fe transport